MRCGRSTASPVAPAGSGGASWRTANAVMVPAASTVSSGRSTLMPAVSSQARDQVLRSRPLVSSSAVSRSVSRVLPQAWRLK